jgi:peptidoglycan hydrolase-like protein with peptidoglycan-binding domain
MTSSVPRATGRVRRHRLGLSTAVALLAAIGGLVTASPALAGSQSPAEARTAEIASSDVTANALSSQPVLRLGARGSAVVYLQNRLAALRYDVGPIDGIFGSQTFHGVVAFQKVNNLVRDGIVGPQTWTRLAQPLVPRPRYSHAGYWVEVNLSKQVVYFARPGAMVRILDASTGKASTPTPAGSFSIYRRIDGWRQSSLGLLWRPNYFYRGYALHGYTSVPSYPASHGCVRVTIPAMNRLWSSLRIGMPVHIYR